MGKIKFFIDPDKDIAARKAPRNGPRFDAFCSRYSPPKNTRLRIIVKKLFEFVLRDFHDSPLYLLPIKPKRFGVTQPFLTKEEKPLSITQCGLCHSTAVRVMVAIFANHLRGVADPIRPVPLLTRTPVYCRKAPRVACQLSSIGWVLSPTCTPC